jgi:hypothetical protein
MRGWAQLTDEFTLRKNGDIHRDIKEILSKVNFDTVICTLYGPINQKSVKLELDLIREQNIQINFSTWVTIEFLILTEEMVSFCAHPAGRPLLFHLVNDTVPRYCVFSVRHDQFFNIRYNVIASAIN